MASFIENHGMDSPPAYRLLDLVSALGEIAKDATESTDYGHSPAGLTVKPDAIGDALCSLLTFADAVDVDPADAHDEIMAKYDERISGSGTASSGN